jgi:DNA-binding transcriptional LysR family regulator
MSGFGIRLNTVELFCAAAKARSFTAAATELGTTPSAISKAVQRLENRLGIKLFQRSTRAVRLTEDGQTYYASCRSAIESIQDAEKTLTRHRSMPRGVLRLSLPYSYGIKRVIPLVPRYVERYLGQVRVSVSLSNSTIDFVTQDFDMSIRLGEVSDSRLVARKLHESHFCVVASPAYLRQHGVPVRPDELRRHSCLGLLMTDSGRVMPWAFSEEDGNAREIAIHPTMTFDHPLGVVAAALSDAGFARLLDFTIRDDLMSGRLVEVLAEFRPPSQAVSAVYPSNRHVSAKVRTFLDFLIESN